MEQNHTENTKRIAKNTLMLYIRMMFSMVVSLYTTRVILDTLGASDYGINNLVGGVVGMMGMVTGLLSQGTSRFITIALGRNDFNELKNTFSASITIHIILAVIIFLVGELVGPYAISKLNIAPDIPYELIGDKVHVKEIINNILTNAIKYTDKGHIILTAKEDFQTGG